MRSQNIEELPEPTDELKTVDYFKVFVQIGQLKGSKQVKVLWCSDNTETIESDESHVHLVGSDDRVSRLKIKSSRVHPSNQQAYQSPAGISSPRQPRSVLSRTTRSLESSGGSNNVNLGECADEDILFLNEIHSTNLILYLN